MDGRLNEMKESIQFSLLTKPVYLKLVVMAKITVLVRSYYGYQKARIAERFGFSSKTTLILDQFATEGIDWILFPLLNKTHFHLMLMDFFLALTRVKQAIKEGCLNFVGSCDFLIDNKK